MLHQPILGTWEQVGSAAIMSHLQSVLRACTAHLFTTWAEHAISTEEALH